MEAKLDPILDTASQLLQAGNRLEARALLIQALKEDTRNGKAWFLLSSALTDPEEQAFALGKAVEFDPDNQEARRRLAEITGTREDEPAAILDASEYGGDIELTPREAPPTVQTETSQAVTTPEEAFRPPPEPTTETVVGGRGQRTPTRKPKPRRVPLWAWILLIGFFILIMAGVGFMMWQLLSSQNMLPVFAPSSTSPPVVEILEPTLTTTNQPTSVPTRSPSPTPDEPTPTPTQDAYLARFEASNCAFKIPEGVQVECGFVIVPEDRQGNSTRTIRLAVAVYKSANSLPTAEPIVYLQGGPGQEAISVLAGSFQVFLEPMLETHDVIVFDQRGMGQSQPKLDCPELNSLYLDDLMRDASDEERLELYLQAFDACHVRHTLQGINLEAYTTEESAADVKDIVSALGYERAILFGISYGTRLALSVMFDYPEVVYSAVLDSVQPREVKFFNEAAFKTDYALDQFFSGCASDSTCSSTYKNLEEDFFELVDQFDAQPVNVEGEHPISRQPTTVEVDGIGLMNSVIWGLWSSEIIPSLPKYIHDIQDGDYTYLKYTWASQGATYNTISLGASYSINCHEQIYATTSEELEADYAKFSRTEAMALSGTLGSGQSLFSICDTWGAAPFDPQTKEPLISDIPALILAGEFDPATPVTFAEQVAKDLSNSFLVKFPGMGHVPSLTSVSDCPRQIVRAFLEEPFERPDDSCVQEMGLPKFFQPYLGEQAIEFVPFSEGEYNLVGEIPEGWKSVGSGYYLRFAHVLDLTQIGFQAATINRTTWLRLLNDRFAGEGFDQPADKNGNYDSDNLYWEVFSASYDGDPVYFAFATSENRTVLALLLCDPAESEALYSNVFLPVLDTINLIQE